jgi:spore maturation protein CgeB
MVTSYCPDTLAASDSLAPVHCFYDLDSPLTLDRPERGLEVDYIGPRGLADFGPVLSNTGARALEQLQSRLGAQAVAPLYGSVDPQVHYPAEPEERYRADPSYLGTNAPDRHEAVRALFVEPAKQLPKRRFVLGGAMYDDAFPW